MIPYDFFQHTIYDNFLRDTNVILYYIAPINTTYHNVLFLPLLNSRDYNNTIIMYDQEPIDFSSFHYNMIGDAEMFINAKNKILMTSEYSDEQKLLQNKLKAQHSHYFYHALLCYEWYRQYWFKDVKINYTFDRTYIIYNNLILDKRLYRANLVVDLHKNNIIDQGYVSYNNNEFDKLEGSVNSYFLLPQSHKANILSNMNLLENKLIIDTDNQHGSLSSEIEIDSIQKAFVNVITETIFYENKVHLTEKTFKPIVAKMPFLLMAGAGNLAYLRKYGFKTFGDYWDEGYDLIQNNTDRYNAVLTILKDLCNKSHAELVEMKRDMQDILEHNFNHFYRDMKPIVVNELLEGLSSSLDSINVSYDQSKLDHLRKILLY